MKFLLLFLALLFCTTVQAQVAPTDADWGQHHPHHGRIVNVNKNKNQNKNTNVNVNQNKAQAKSQSKATATGGDASVGDTSAVSGDSTSTSTGSDVTVSGDTNERQVATAIAPISFPTADCMGGGGLGAQGAGFGFSIGGGRVMPGCNRRADAQTLNALGEKAGAVALMCQDDAVNTAMPARCEAARQGR